ncbi:hypothetical protein CLF_112527 [Clonorchis sinensis]|uniref:Uncharacterized protein n=1 Tax=Clonorchis sinensis TaxID=79923 RepID=G7YWJ0_CLOSI|nr:hypothetical protein CLF_112527 [Clonorchis sinensis]
MNHQPRQRWRHYAEAKYIVLWKVVKHACIVMRSCSANVYVLVHIGTPISVVVSMLVIVSIIIKCTFVQGIREALRTFGPIAVSVCDDGSLNLLPFTWRVIRKGQEGCTLLVILSCPSSSELTDEDFKTAKLRRLKLPISRIFGSSWMGGATCTLWDHQDTTILQKVMVYDNHYGRKSERHPMSRGKFCTETGKVSQVDHIVNDNGELKERSWRTRLTLGSVTAARLAVMKHTTVQVFVPRPPPGLRCHRRLVVSCRRRGMAQQDFHLNDQRLNDRYGPPGFQYPEPNYHSV